MRWKWRPCFWSQRMVNGHKISVFNGPSQFFQHSYSIYQPFSSFQFIVRIHQHLLIPTMFNSIYLRFFAVSWRALASDSRVWPISRWGSFWGLSFVHTQLVSRRSGALLTDQRRNQKEESDADSLCTFPLSLPPSPFIFLFVSGSPGLLISPLPPQLLRSCNLFVFIFLTCDWDRAVVFHLGRYSRLSHFIFFCMYHILFPAFGWQQTGLGGSSRL